MLPFLHPSILTSIHSHTLPFLYRFISTTFHSCKHLFFHSFILAPFHSYTFLTSFQSQTLSFYTFPFLHFFYSCTLTYLYLFNLTSFHSYTRLSLQLFILTLSYSDIFKFPHRSFLTTFNSARNKLLHVVKGTAIAPTVWLMSVIYWLMRYSVGLLLFTQRNITDSRLKFPPIPFSFLPW